MRQMYPDSAKNKHGYLGFLAGSVLMLLGKKPYKSTGQSLYKKDFTYNTQKMGLTFTEKVRECFRFRWLTLKKDPPQKPEEG